MNIEAYSGGPFLSAKLAGHASVAEGWWNFACDQLGGKCVGLLLLCDPGPDNADLVGFDRDYPHVIPAREAVLEKAKEWIEEASSARLAYFSAQEEAVETPIRPKRRLRRSAVPMLSCLSRCCRSRFCQSWSQALASRQEALEIAQQGPGLGPFGWATG